jgi:hypothetical protein
MLGLRENSRVNPTAGRHVEICVAHREATHGVADSHGFEMAPQGLADERREIVLIGSAYFDSLQSLYNFLTTIRRSSIPTRRLQS